MELSEKGKKLVALYSEMTKKGYERKDKSTVVDVFSDFESRAYRHQLKNDLKNFKIKSILDYGCGGSVWDENGFDENGQSAKDFYDLHDCFRYEPSRGIDERQQVDCVISFDVLEHIFIADVSKVINDIFSYAERLVIINVACYPAAALLPNGENAHITVRHPIWWKSAVDNIALNYPDVSVLLLTSTGWRETTAFPIFKTADWLNSKNFVIKE